MPYGSILISSLVNTFNAIIASAYIITADNIAIIVANLVLIIPPKTIYL